MEEKFLLSSSSSSDVSPAAPTLISSVDFLIFLRLEGFVVEAPIEKLFKFV